MFCKSFNCNDRRKEHSKLVEISNFFVIFILCTTLKRLREQRASKYWTTIMTRGPWLMILVFSWWEFCRKAILSFGMASAEIKKKTLLTNVIVELALYRNRTCLKQTSNLARQLHKIIKGTMCGVKWLWLSIRQDRQFWLILEKSNFKWNRIILMLAISTDASWHKTVQEQKLIKKWNEHIVHSKTLYWN